MTTTTYHEMLNVLCPMHVILDSSGEIVHVGPTASKLLPENATRNQAFLDVFEVKRPRAIACVHTLRQSAGTKLHLKFRKAPQQELKGVLVEGPMGGQMIVNLSFGIFVVDAIQDFKLTASDFAATDLTIEMLYLVEAKSAAMEASRQLNQRLEHAREAAQTEALTDTLTGLSNRRAMDAVLERLIRSRSQFSLMHIDLDFFKAVNDTLGHAAGDHVLLEVARIMKEETRSIDTVARVGGDEFVILIPGVDDPTPLGKIADRVIARLREPIPFDADLCRISASIGTVLGRDYVDPTPELLLADADAALYVSKRNGRGRHSFFEPSMRSIPQLPTPRESEEDWQRSA